MFLAGKLAYRGFLNAVTPGRLVHVLGQTSNRRFLVDTGASYSIFPHRSATPPSGPRLSGPTGSHIPCWGEKELTLSFSGRHFTWTFLLLDVQFPILGVNFLQHHCLLVDPAANKLVSSSPVGKQISTVAMVQHSLASSSSSSHQPASEVTVVKEPSGSSVAALQAGHSAPASSSVTAANSQPSWCQVLLEQFTDVVNPSQQLPELPDSTDVLHHIRHLGCRFLPNFGGWIVRNYWR